MKRSKVNWLLKQPLVYRKKGLVSTERAMSTFLKQEFAKLPRGTGVTARQAHTVVNNVFGRFYTRLNGMTSTASQSYDDLHTRIDKLYRLKR